MKFAEISVHCIAKSVISEPAVREWLDSIGATELAIPDCNAATSAEVIVGLAAKRCYKSFQVGLNPNVTKIRSDWAEYLDNVLKSGHGSVLEHASWTWAIENCTRVFTAEMNRHRAGVAISEGSLRYIRFQDEGIPFWMPLSIRPNENDAADLKEKKRQTVFAFRRLLTNIQDVYSDLVDVWELDKPGVDFAQKKQITSMLRRIIPIGVCTGAVYTLNCRALRHVMTMRCAPEAEEEIAYVVGMIAKEMVASDPKLFGDFAQTPDGFWTPKYKKV